MNLKFPNDLRQMLTDYVQLKYVFIAGGLVQVLGAVCGYIFRLSTAQLDSAFVGAFLATPLAMVVGIALQNYLDPESMRGKAYFVALAGVASVGLFLAGVVGIGDCLICLPTIR